MPREDSFLDSLGEGNDVEEDSGLLKVGEKVRQLRRKQGLSLQQLAEKTGFSTAVLSQIETHMVSPSLGNLIKLAHSFNVPVGHFLTEGEGGLVAIVRRDERKIVSRYASKEGVSYGYSYYSLGADMKDRHMEPFIVTLEPPATGHTEKMSCHEGEEFLFVLEGEMEVKLGKLTDILKPGDSIYYHSRIPHLVRCHEDKAARILAVLFAG